jgi:LuxR family transcriptional regulator, maltose regulon positive regulatory protein
VTTTAEVTGWVRPSMAAGDSPPNVAHAIVRSGVLDRLERRWDCTVTTVVAGAGFGKSVSIGQAMRANRARPRGIEGWVACRTGCESPQRLARSVEAAYGAPTDGRGTPLSRLHAVFTDLAPLHVSLVLDEVELLPEASATLLDELLRRAPSNLHLVLSGRQLPLLALARFRAADDVVEIGADVLRFDEAEVAALTTSLHASPLQLDLGGWPALVRLALVAPRRSVDEFLWEEVIRALSSPDREALLALCLLGASAVDEVEAVTGRPFDPDAFNDRVPLVHRVGDQVVAHDLWTPYLEGLGSATEIAAVSKRAFDAVAARGDPIATGAMAIRLGDDHALRRAGVELVRATLGSLPVEIAEAWMSTLGERSAAAEHERPVEAELLDCALAHARSAAAPSADRLDRLAEEFHERDDLAGESVTLALGTLAADARSDLGHLVSLAVRARGLAEDYDEPVLRLLVIAVDAAATAMGGDLDRALALLARPAPGVSPDDRPEALVRLHWHLLILAGRAGEAADLTADLDPVPGMAAQRKLSGVARWLDGDPSGLFPGAVDIGPDRYRQLSERDRFDQAAFVAVIAASGGDPDPVHHALDVLESSPFAVAVGPDAALVAVARACRAIVDHDDQGAAAVIARFVDQGPVDPLTDAHLRRSLAVPYVCSPELRERWDGTSLGPSQQRARAAARLLVDARSGVGPAASPDVLSSLCTALPLPWSVELATRAAAVQAPWGLGLAVQLTDRFGEGVTRELDRRVDDPDDRVRRGAEAVLRALPARPPGALQIRVLGPLEVHREGQPVDTPEVHRTRVRELLSLLVVERTVSRDRVIDALWPDVDPTRGRANLRVTLRHLQRLLEPERGQGSSPYFLRGDTQQLQLTDLPGLEVDCWHAEARLAQAEAARRRGDSAGRTDHLRAAVGHWRGRPLADLERLADLDHVARHLETRLIDAALTLGELELVGGAVDAATTLAEQVLGADPYVERAHRLAIAAHMQGRDRSATTAAVRRLDRMLAELDAKPETTTQILLRNAAQWLRPAPVASALDA